MDIKLIAMDLDGTLTMDNKEVSAYTVDILHQAAARGVKIALASGRPTLGIHYVAKAVGLAEMGGYILGFNSGHILDCATGRDIYKAVFPKEYIREAADFAKKAGFPIISYDDESILTEGPADEYVLHEVLNTKAPVKLVPDLPAYLDFPIVKMVVCGNPDALDPVEPEMARQFAGRLDIYRAETCFLEVMPKGVNKAAGIRRLAEHLGISREQVMVCGDGNNDIPMLEAAGLSVAVENASQPVKRIAHYITKSNNEDGVALAIKKFVLDGEEA